MILTSTEEAILRRLLAGSGPRDAYNLRVELGLDVTPFIEACWALEVAGYLSSDRDHGQHSVAITPAGVELLTYKPRPPSPASTPYPRPARLQTGAAHAALDVVGGWIRSIGSRLFGGRKDDDR